MMNTIHSQFPAPGSQFIISLMVYHRSVVEDAHTFEVGEEHDGLRLDRFLVEALPGASRGVVRMLLDGGGVRVAGRHRKKGHLVRVGDQVVVTGYVQPDSWSPLPDTSLEIAVLHQDLDMIAVDKPAGVACHPMRSDEMGTVASAMVVAFPELSRLGTPRREAGLVHRLDTSTSGVLIFGRRRRSLRHLVSQMRGDGGAIKDYDALVEGDATGLGTIEMPLESRGRRVVALSSEDLTNARRGRPARTEVRSIRRVGEFTLLEVRISAGYRHQIRAHLKAVGHPIAHDELYGATLPSNLSRPFLHARRVLLESPSTGEPLSIEAPLPRDLDAELSTLEKMGKEAGQG